MGCKLPKQAHDLTGERYGKLVVVAFSHSDKGCWWLCRCDCGSEGIYYAANLKRGGTRSCGCSHRDNYKKRLVKEDKRTLWRRAVSGYKNNAKNRGIAFELTEDQAIETMKQDCHYCKAPPQNRTTSGGNNQTDYVLHSGIDRVDNSRGYEQGNVVPCCKVCNLAKRDMSEREFLTWVHRIARHTVEPEFSFDELTENDLVRHPVIEEVLALYDT